MAENKADRRLKEYYAKLQSANRKKQGVCNGSQGSEKLRERAKVHNS